MRFFSLLFLSAWCGLAAGLLEVATIIVRKRFLDPDQLLRMSRHFVWLVPVSNVLVFLTLGLLGCGISLFWPRSGRWLSTRVLGALTLLPSLLIAFPRVYSIAWLIVALGMAVRFVPLVESRSRDCRRFVLLSFSVGTAIVAILGVSLWVGDRSRQLEATGRPLPPPGSPNVLLIVLDTVAASHLSLHGYDRPTSPTLTELAGRGIRFDRARAASSWTLPSHASMFTGRWMHELSVGWLTPLDRSAPTVAEYLGGRGYATAGFIANTGYCAIDSGLSRGFSRYQDYIFPELTALKTAVLVNRGMQSMRAVIYFTEDWLDAAGLLGPVNRGMRSLDEADRKAASVVNCELLDWLAKRDQPDRPFFAFLNYNDAHYPYELPPGHMHRFGAEPGDNSQRYLIQQWGDLDKKAVSPVGVAFALDCYDDCIADLDEQLGKLFDVLEQKRVLEQTWVIITADHGEAFGEHAGLFGHGVSLYETEIHVPLVIIPPGERSVGKVVNESVSLRDVAATIVDLAGQQASSPLPGSSLARFWKPPGEPAQAAPAPPSPALSELIFPYDTRKRAAYWRMPQDRQPLAALKGDEWSYIRHEANGREELFQLHADPNEQHDLAADPSFQATLDEMRALLHLKTDGPLLPERFGR